MERRARIVSRPRPETPTETAIRLENNRRSEIRHNFLVPIYVMWTSDVPEDEGRAGLQGVLDTLRASGQKREVINFGSSGWEGIEFSNPDWYLDEAIRRQGGLRINPNHGGAQVLTHFFGQLFYQEPWQEKPHWEVMIINKDLTTGDPDNNFVLGATSSEFPYSVQSVTRLEREIPDKDMRLKVIRRLLRHEVGHMFGLPSYQRRNTEQNLGLHCTNVCTMKQEVNSTRWVNKVMEEERAGVHFCNDCITDLQRNRNRYKPLSS